MATHASAEKRNRQRIKRTARNRAAKSSLRTEVKKARGTIAATQVHEGSPGKPSAAPVPLADAAKAVNIAWSALDRAAAKGIVPRRRADRVKGRLAAALHKKTKAIAT
jgi:small subunit ribosomal protein S20